MVETRTNLGESVLSFDIAADDLTLEVDSADSPDHAFPDTGDFRIIIDSEIIIVGDRTGSTFTDLTRGAEENAAGGHAPAAHLAGSLVMLILSTGAFEQGVIDLIETVVLVGSGTPEGVVTADPTSMYRDTLHNELYLKAGGTGNAGWVLLTHPNATAHAGYARMDVNDHTQYVQETAVANFKGDMLVGTANDTVTRLGVGTNGQRLTADSTKTEGVKWA